jgi:hypothetical protein
VQARARRRHDRPDPELVDPASQEHAVAVQPPSRCGEAAGGQETREPAVAR